MSVRRSHSRQSDPYVWTSFGDTRFMVKPGMWVSKSRAYYVANRIKAGKIVAPILGGTVLVTVEESGLTFASV